VAAVVQDQLSTWRRQDVGGSARGRCLAFCRIEISKFHIARCQFAERKI